MKKKNKKDLVLALDDMVDKTLAELDAILNPPPPPRKSSGAVTNRPEDCEQCGVRTDCYMGRYTTVWNGNNWLCVDCAEET